MLSINTKHYTEMLEKGRAEGNTHVLLTHEETEEIITELTRLQVKVLRMREINDLVGSWLSAALDDPNAGADFKSALGKWFDENKEMDDMEAARMQAVVDANAAAEAAKPAEAEDLPVAVAVAAASEIPEHAPEPLNG